MSNREQNHAMYTYLNANLNITRICVLLHSNEKNRNKAITIENVGIEK